MGCGSWGAGAHKAKYVCSKCGREETRESKKGEVVKSCCGEVMIKKEDYINRLATELKEWGAKIDLLEVKAEKVEGEIKITLSKEIERLKGLNQDAQKKLKELREKTGDAWKILSGGAEKAWKDLREATIEAARKFK